MGGLAPPNETVAVFRVRRDVEYGLAFYRNREVVNYEETGVPDEEHLLVARVTGRGGVDLHTPAALEEYLEGPPLRAALYAGPSRDLKFTWWDAKIHGPDSVVCIPMREA